MLIEKIVHKISSIIAEKKKAYLLNSIGTVGENVTVGEYTLIQNPKSVSIGKDTQIGDFTVLLGGNMIEIGERCRISTSCMISSVSHKIPSLDRHKDDYVDGTNMKITICHNVWIGATSVILPGSKIGENSIISAGSVVKGIIPANEIWGGTPAVFISNIRF